jgi:ATP-dependent Clp protease adaptor protein ClpS
MMGFEMTNATQGTPDARVLERAEAETRLPRLYRVLLHNDDYTTMDFVVEVLEGIFGKSPAEAFRIMLHVHENGVGVCGAYPHEIAETKVALVHERARGRGFPLRASLEEG